MAFTKTAFFCQLPIPYHPGDIKDGEWIGISRKANGVHAIFINGELYSREKHLIRNAQDMIDELWMLNEALGGTPSNPFVIEGELLCTEGPFKDEFDQFQKTSALLQKYYSDKSNMKLMLFDAVTKDEYMAEGREGKTPYSVRKKNLVSAYKAIEDDVTKLNLVNFLYEGYDHSKIEEYFKYSESKNWEGIVINRDVGYACAKGNGAFKYKHVNTLDLKIIDFKPGNGVNRGTLGSIIVDYKGNPVSVGTGLKREERDYIWTHRPQLLGRIAEVRYQSITHRGDIDSLQFPVYICIREEGKDISDNT